MDKGMIFDIQDFCTGDGPGIRTTVFFKGCNLSCTWCHNPEGQNALPQMLVYRDKCVGCGLCERTCPNGLAWCDLCGKCAFMCPHDARKISGREYCLQEVMDSIRKDAVYYKNSGGGATFSGGECMLQIDFLQAVLQACKHEGIHTAVDTAGHVPYEHFERILPFADLFLFDFKCFDSRLHRLYTGVENSLILENLKRLLESGVPIWIRIPVIAGVNDTEGEMRSIKQFLDAHGRPERVELLAYHSLGEHKYEAAGMKPVRFDAPDEETMQTLRAIFD